MDIKSFQRAMAQIAEARGISPEVIIETLEIVHEGVTRVK